MKSKREHLLLPALLLSLLMLTGCTSKIQREYDSGEALLAEGNYQESASKFETLGSYAEASRLLMYSRAALAAESGDYDTARLAFNALGDFRDVPEMLLYYEAREMEASGRAALDSGSYEDALGKLTDASSRYAALSSFRDAGQRGADCLTALYDCGNGLLSLGEYDAARGIFAALGDLADSRALAVYCEARLLEEEGSLLEAAARFAGIPSLLDAAQRAETDREQVYQQALSLSADGDLETAASLLASLGSYRDSSEQGVSIMRGIIRERLKKGDFEGALFQLDASDGAIALERLVASDRARFSTFLDDFVHAYLHFSAGTMDATSGYYGVVPYIVPGGALDWRFRQVLMIGDYSHNSSFNYYGSELLDVYDMGSNCYLAYIRASASSIQPAGVNEVTRTFRIVVRDSADGMAAGSIEDCLYGDTVNPTGRPVVTGPLPNGELPSDDDGDGIIVVDVKKKGFQGTMIIVLDPSRVFVGFPGFYGGSGMLLEDLIHRYNALGGINGGGFIDEDGGGSGGLPEGLTVVEGETYYWLGSGASAAFDEENVLHVGSFTVEEAAKMGIRDCVSFGPALIVNGVGEYGSYMESGVNPRTAIGQREDGAVLLLCIDGRQLHSIGANFGDLRDVMLDFGAVNACSLDGGSTTVMYLNGSYLNSPSSASGTSRYLPNAFLIRK